MKTSNKLREVMLNEYSQTRNLQVILNRVGENKNMKVIKNILVPVCGLLLIVVCYFLFQDNEDETLVGNNKIYINNIKEQQMSQFDADIITVSDINEHFFELYPFVNEIIVPQGLVSSVNGVYIRSGLNSNYNILNNYVIRYENETKRIYISFSEEYTPIRDYYFSSKEDKISNINGCDVKIYKQGSSYLVFFEYNNIIFDIETTNITENELITLIESIAK